MLKKLTVDNFRCLEEFEIEFGGLSLLLGVNGAGKSTVFEVIQRLCDFVVGHKEVDEVFPRSTITRWQKSANQIFDLLIDGPGGVYDYTLMIAHHPERGTAQVFHESLTFNEHPICVFENGKLRLPGPSGSSAKKNDFPFDRSLSVVGRLSPRGRRDRLSWFKQFMSRLIVVGPFSHGIGSIAHAEDAVLDADGGNFPNWYRHISQERQDLILEVFDKLRPVIGGFRSLTLPEGGSDQRLLRVKIARDDKQKKVIDYSFEDLSDGERILIILYTLLFANRGLGYALLIDEPDNFLALSEIQPWLMELQDLCDDGEIQALLISHHPEVIDYLGPENGIWLKRKPNCPTEVAAGPDAADESLSLSEVVARGWE